MSDASGSVELGRADYCCRGKHRRTDDISGGCDDCGGTTCIGCDSHACVWGSYGVREIGEDLLDLVDELRELAPVIRAVQLPAFPLYVHQGPLNSSLDGFLVAAVKFDDTRQVSKNLSAVQELLRAGKDLRGPLKTYAEYAQWWHCPPTIYLSPEAHCKFHWKLAWTRAFDDRRYELSCSVCCGCGRPPRTDVEGDGVQQCLNCACLLRCKDSTSCTPEDGCRWENRASREIVGAFLPRDRGIWAEPPDCDEGEALLERLDNLPVPIDLPADLAQSMKDLTKAAELRLSLQRDSDNKHDEGPPCKRRRRLSAESSSSDTDD